MCGHVCACVYAHYRKGLDGKVIWNEINPGKRTVEGKSPVLREAELMPHPLDGQAHSLPPLTCA